MWVIVAGKRFTKTEELKSSSGFTDADAVDSGSVKDEAIKGGRFSQTDLNRVSSLTRCFSSLHLENLEPVTLKRWGSVGSSRKRPRGTIKRKKILIKSEVLPIQEHPWTLKPNLLIDLGLLLFSGLTLLYYHYAIAVSALSVK